MAFSVATKHLFALFLLSPLKRKYQIGYEVFALEADLGPPLPVSPLAPDEQGGDLHHLILGIEGENDPVPPHTLP